MLFVASDQVKYCQVTCLVDNELKTFKGMFYRDKLFTKLHSFPTNEKHDAIKKAKAISLENKGHFLVILVEESKRYVIWQQNDQVKIKLKEPQDIPISEINLQELVTKMRNIGGIRIEDRRYKLRVYPRCFVGSEAVIWFMESLKLSQENAILLGQRLIDEKLIHHVNDNHDFKDEHLFYRFYWDEKQLETTGIKKFFSFS